jgi:hypothetical protein
MLTIGEIYFICRCNCKFSRISPDTVSLRSRPPAVISQLPAKREPPLSASVSAAPFRCNIYSIGAFFTPTSGKNSIQKQWVFQYRMTYACKRALQNADNYSGSLYISLSLNHDGSSINHQETDANMSSNATALSTFTFHHDQLG